MSYQIVNLTLLFVIKEIEDILVYYPEYPYQVAFSIPYWRQRLIAYVLNHVRNRHIVIENTKKLSEDPNLTSFPSDERLRIENWIRSGIILLLQDNPDWANYRIPQKEKVIYNLDITPLIRNNQSN
ncbi:hypothetical protein NIES593_06765 [Hydrococcus rivularis NIES-593]|uniref:Uncharacterized protein n=1 Tax=Hydrococcus rivularis NIES-593 TaxID=1921803 RepID=A0A1U7HMY6_9CYAN|nr:hypothetical protein [Hydrococcus rivularis]OKH24908.1 hypothetical protein NIES593_06765 [Hydrococcus rivularis NIES-593]